MKAIVIAQPGGPETLRLEERPAPQPGDGQVLIKVKAAGVNRPDVAQRKGHYPAPDGAPPDIPGLEIAGVVESCGRGAERWKPGDAVCALVGGGGYAAYAVAFEGHCLPLPAGWSFAEAASLPETMFTVWHNVFQRGQLQPGEHLLVHGGSSGIGITAIQLAAATGATVYATAGTEEKCRACEELGAARCINYKATDFEEALMPLGVDVILDMVGGNYTQKNLRLLLPEGRLVFINTMSGSKTEVDMLHVMQRRLTITGSTLRNREPVFKSMLATEVEKHVWPLIGKGLFKPVLYKVFPLEAAAEAHSLIESSRHIGKIVLEVA